MSLAALALFALVEAGLMIAIGIMAAFVVQRLTAQMVLLWGLRFGLFLVVMIGLVFLARYSAQTFQFNTVTDYASFCDRGFDYPPPAECPTYFSLRNQQRLVETLQVGLTSLVDGGTLVQLNLLNNSLNLADGSYRPSLGSLARNAISVGIGLMLYSALIGLAMWLAGRIAQNRAKG